MPITKLPRIRRNYQQKNYKKYKKECLYNNNNNFMKIQICHEQVRKYISTSAMIVTCDEKG
jgi:hypothetical protein